MSTNNCSFISNVRRSRFAKKIKNTRQIIAFGIRHSDHHHPPQREGLEWHGDEEWCYRVEFGIRIEESKVRDSKYKESELQTEITKWIVSNVQAIHDERTGTMCIVQSVDCASTVQRRCIQ